jgi:hypothetical protein
MAGPTELPPAVVVSYRIGDVGELCIRYGFGVELNHSIVGLRYHTERLSAAIVIEEIYFLILFEIR